MKNGLFNIIHGVAFCFVLSIICLFGRVDIFAMNVDGSFISSLVSSHFNISIPQEQIDKLDKFANYYSVYDKFIFMGGGNHCSCFGYLPKSNDVILSGTDLELYCNSNGYEYLSDIFFRDSSYSCYVRVNGSNEELTGNIFWYHVQLSDGSISDYCPDIYYNQYNAYGKVLYSSSFESNSEYDSTLGYLTNIKVKRASPFLLTDISADFTNIIDRFSWDSVTSGGSSIDGVDVKLKIYKNANILEEVETHIECPQNNYNFDWSDYIDLFLKDWVDTNQYKYEIFMRPTLGDKYGDYCFVSSVLPNDYNSRVDSSKASQFLTDTVQYKENVGNIEDFTSFAIPEDTQTLYVANYVTSNKTIDELESYLNSNIIPDSSLTLEDLKNNSVSAESSSSVKYILDINNTYKVLIPKSIELAPDSEGNYTAEYNVKLSNFDIIHNKIVKILSPVSIEITRNGTNYKVTSFNDLNKDVEGNQDTIAIEGKGDEKIFTGYINAGKLVSGTWNAKLTFTITLENN